MGSSRGLAPQNWLDLEQHRVAFSEPGEGTTPWEPRTQTDLHPSPHLDLNCAISTVPSEFRAQTRAGWCTQAVMPRGLRVTSAGVFAELGLRASWRPPPTGDADTRSLAMCPCRCFQSSILCQTAPHPIPDHRQGFARVPVFLCSYGLCGVRSFHRLLRLFLVSLYPSSHGDLFFFVLRNASERTTVHDQGQVLWGRGCWGTVAPWALEVISVDSSAPGAQPVPWAR